MGAMPRTLHGKLALTLFLLVSGVALLFLVVSGVALLFLVVTVTVSRGHEQAIVQSLNRGLARTLLDEHWLTDDSPANPRDVREMISRVMAINPTIEIYLLRPGGEIIAHSAPPDSVQRDRVAVEPILAFLSRDARLPIEGDDPRGQTARKVFSAAPILSGGRIEGYIYVILGSQAYQSTAGSLERGYFLTLGTWMVALLLALTALIALVAFHMMTRRLRRLSVAVTRFRAGDFRVMPAATAWPDAALPDEIDELARAFRAMAERIGAQLDQLQAMDAARRELVAGVSHDLRTPLAAMQGYLETALIKETELTAEDRRRYLQLALRNGERLAPLIRDLFELAALEAPGMAPCREPLDLAELAHDVAQKQRLGAEAKGIVLQVEIPPAPARVAADIGMVARLLENLLDNAVKYTPTGGRIGLAIRAEPTEVMVAISDSGPGIPAAERARIFQPGVRLPGARTDAGKGLGLAIAARIVALHGGRLAVDDAPEGGARFTVTLPRAP